MWRNRKISTETIFKEAMLLAVGDYISVRIEPYSEEGISMGVEVTLSIYDDLATIEDDREEYVYRHNYEEFDMPIDKYSRKYIAPAIEDLKERMNHAIS